jgi:SEC-C motif domain protein
MIRAHNNNLCLLLLSVFIIITATTVFQLPRATLAFAAAAKKKGGNNNNKKKSKTTASTNRGFGAPPPTLEEVIASFKTRLPQDDPNTTPCPCGIYPGKSYADCCQPFHLGQQTCQTPLQVLQTRYSAFTYRLCRYIMDTTHPTCREYRTDGVAWAKSLNKDGMFDSFDFVNLQVLLRQEGETEEANNDDESSAVAYIEFQVTLRGRSDATSAAAVAGQETIVQERSQFRKDDISSTGVVWRYSGGDVRSQVAGLEDVSLNV